MTRSALLVACFLGLLILPACGGEADPEGDTESRAAGTPPTKPQAPEGPPSVAATWRGEAGTLVFTAYDMSCSGCSSTVQDRLGGLEGVDAVTADHKTDEIEIELAEDADVEALKPLIVKALEEPESGKKFKVVQATP